MKKLLTTSLFLPLTISPISCFITKPHKQKSEEGNYDKNHEQLNLIKSSLSFKDVAGYNVEKKELNKAINIIKNPEKYSKNNVFSPKGILLEGAPGTGKSLLAKAFVGEANLYHLFLSGSEFDNMYVGVGAANIRKIFAAARNYEKQCVIIIDEIDSIGRKRNGIGKDHTSPQTLNQLLKEMTDDNNKNIILIGTTNLISELDPALIRSGRFDIKLSFSSTSKQERKEIFEFYASKINDIKEAKLNYDYLAEISENMVGSDVKLIVDNVAVKIIQTSSSENILQMFEEEIETKKFGPQTDVKRTDDEVKKTAYLQAAVAINTQFYEINKISIIPRGKKFGFISLEEKNKIKTANQIKDEIKILLAGIAYETLILDTNESMSEKETENWHKANKLVSKLKHDFYTILSTDIIQKCLEDAKNVIINSKTKFDTLANELIKQKSLNKEEILRLVK